MSQVGRSSCGTAGFNDVRNSFMPSFIGFLLFALASVSAGLFVAPGSSYAQSRVANRVLGADPDLMEARRAFERGVYQRAAHFARMSRTGARGRAERAEAHSILCTVYRIGGALEESLKACDAGLRLSTDDAWRILANRAQTLEALGRWDESLDDFQSAAERLEHELGRSRSYKSARRHKFADSLESINARIAETRRLAARPPPSVIEGQERSSGSEARAYGPGSLRATGDFSEGEPLESPQ